MERMMERFGAFQIYKTDLVWFSAYLSKPDSASKHIYFFVFMLRYCPSG